MESTTSYDYATGIYGTEELEDSIRFRENFTALALLFYSNKKSDMLEQLTQFEVVRAAEFWR